MDHSKKIFFLILLLILLIVGCVYTHAQKIYDGSLDKPLKMVEKVVQPLDNDVEDILIKEELDEIKPELVTQETIVEVNNPSEENIHLSKNENTTIENEALEKIAEEVIEEEKIVFPLFTTDIKYKRTNGDKLIEDMSEETQLLQAKLNDIINLNPIKFKNGSYRPLKSSYAKIAELAEFLKEHKNIKVEIAGHTTKVGKAYLNKQTSVFRAANVKKRLIKLGINKKRMKARGYGESISLVEDGNSELNRRIEFNIIGEKYK